MKKFWRFVAQQRKYTEHYQLTYLHMVMMVRFMVFTTIEKNKRRT